MNGDDTWLKLFPGLFERHDGVTSFFVSLLYEYKMKIFYLTSQSMKTSH